MVLPTPPFGEIVATVFVREICGCVREPLLGNQLVALEPARDQRAGPVAHPRRGVVAQLPAVDERPAVDLGATERCARVRQLGGQPERRRIGLRGVGRSVSLLRQSSSFCPG